MQSGHNNYGYNVIGYYPDSDLETIAEESSVIDSEAGGSIRSRLSSQATSVRSGGSDDSDCTIQSNDDFTQQPMGGEMVDNLKSNNKIVQNLTINSLLSSGNEEIVDQLSTSPDDMFAAAKSGNLKLLSQFTSEELSSTLDEKGNTLLHIAAESGHLQLVKNLSSVYSPNMISMPNDEILSATGLAIKSGNIECAKWLIKNTKAKEELVMSTLASNIDGFNTRWPVAHIAAKYDREDMLEWLCDEMTSDDVSIDVSNHMSDAAIHVAARNGNIKCVQALVARGASVTILNSQGETPAQAAQKSGHSVCVGYLVVVETCVSLAQQVVVLKEQVESLQGKSELENKSEIEEFSEIIEENKPEAVSLDRNMNRKQLQEQPPPPKMWLDESQTSNNIMKSPKISKENSFGPVNKNTDMKNTAKEVDEPTAELQRLTKGLSMSMRTWENMTIDEVLKKAREVRYQPSPSISHLTEDSTIEPAHVIRDRLAAASRWYLNNKTQQNEPPQKQANNQKKLEHNDKNKLQNSNVKKINNSNASYQKPPIPNTNSYRSDHNTSQLKSKAAPKNIYSNLKLRQANGDNETISNGNKLKSTDENNHVDQLKNRRNFVDKNSDKKNATAQQKISSYNKKPNKVENSERFRKRVNVFESNNSNKNLAEKPYSKQSNEHHAPPSSRQLNSSTQRSGSYRS